MTDALSPRQLAAAAVLSLQVVGVVGLALPMWLTALLTLAALATIAWAMRMGGAETMHGTLIWWVWPPRAVRALVFDDETPASARRDRQATNAAHIAAIVAGGDVTRLTGGSDPAAGAGAFRQHRMGRTGDDGSVGWWIDVPADAGLVQLRAQASSGAAVVVHAAKDGAWVEAAGPAGPVLVHRCELPAGQVYLRAALADPSAGSAHVDVWVEPPPAGAGAGDVPIPAAAA
ncbi:MAG: hypothetical protein KDC46_08965 [Thermoleophilia bacterium]|nr:hypothetical protein [Thermoleophilia bacterium]